MTAYFRVGRKVLNDPQYQTLWEINNQSMKAGGSRLTKKCRMSFMDVPFLFIERLLDLSSLCIRKREGGTMRKLELNISMQVLML